MRFFGLGQRAGITHKGESLSFVTSLDFRANRLMQAQKFHIERVSGDAFLKNCLNRTAKVVEFGANKGDFARTINSRYGCPMIGVEANTLLAGRMAVLGGDITCKKAAIAGHDGRIKFSIRRGFRGQHNLDLYVLAL
jgi:hypothetical protein